MTTTVRKSTPPRQGMRLAYLIELPLGHHPQFPDRPMWLAVHRRTDGQREWTDDPNDAQQFTSINDADRALRFHREARNVPFTEHAEIVEHGFVGENLSNVILGPHETDDGCWIGKEAEHHP